MKNRKFIVIIYLFLIVCGIQISTKICERREESQYEKALRQIKYQLDYIDTYSKDFSDDLQETNASAEERVAYLTFDDGPSPRTEEILDLLKENDIKATFFVINCKDEYIPYMKRASEEGHTIGVHSYSHKYEEIYKSVDAYLEDFTKCYEFIYENTGKYPSIFRFPGGSVNSFNKLTRKDIAREMARRGFAYFDWNVDSGDGMGKLSAQTIYKNVTDGCKGKRRAVIIMHDSIGKRSTAEALGDIIKTLKDDGWVFRPLDKDVKPMVFRMK